MSDAYGVKPVQNGSGKADGSEREGVASQAKAFGRDLKSKASELTDAVSQTAKDQVSDLGSTAKELAGDAKSKIEKVVSDQKSAGADYIGTFAHAVHRAAGEFEGDIPQAAQYIRQAADQIDTVANAVRDRNIRELIGEVEQFARRQPTIFFGGAMVLGFAALRFFKTTAPSQIEGGADLDKPVASPSISAGDTSYSSQAR